MKYTWIQDPTGRNVVHCFGCAKIQMHNVIATFDADTIEQAMVYIAADNCDPDITTAKEAAEWVSVSPCAQ